MVLRCYDCGKEIHFDPEIKSPSGKSIPLSGKTGTAKHRCPNKPFNKKTRRQYAREQERKRLEEDSKRVAEEFEEELKKWAQYTMTPRIDRYLQVLGLSASCSDMAEIKNAYRKLALQYHPDRSGDPSTADRFRQITEAYEKCRNILKNELEI